MERYPELVRRPQCAEQFFNEFKDVLPQESLLAGFNFALSCDNFHWAFNKYLLSCEEITLYRTNTHIRNFFLDNYEHPRRLVLFAVFIHDYLQITESLLLDREYYELMAKFTEAKMKIEGIIKILMADHVGNTGLSKLGVNRL